MHGLRPAARPTDGRLATGRVMEARRAKTRMDVRRLPPRAASRKEGKTMPDYMTHPDTAEARVIWGHRQRGADAALAHLEAAAASLVAAWEINE